MMVKLTKMTTFVFAGAAGAAIAFSPIAGAEPAPPPCWNPDGTPCASVGSAGPGGANVAIPGGPVGEAGPGGASGVIPGGPGGTAGPGGASGVIPGGPVGSAGPGGASGCIPGIGCATIPAP